MSGIKNGMDDVDVERLRMKHMLETSKVIEKTLFGVAGGGEKLPSTKELELLEVLDRMLADISKAIAIIQGDLK
jgi:hypothetical protein